jgi:lipopolysaccharide export system protein LptA
MPLPVSRLRRWFALAALALTLAVAGLYLHLRHGVQDVLKQVPGKMGLDIQQTAEGFRVSKSDQGRTLFTIEASKAVQFKQGGHAELHGVTITLYGRDSSRFDQIYGEEFQYDPHSGEVTAVGEVRIDLEANPQGLLKPDQSAPSNLKNPIHLLTRDLVFNQKTGNAFTNAQVDLRMPQAEGSALGVRYTENAGLLRLESNVHFVVKDAGGAVINATSADITKEPRQIVLQNPRLTRRDEVITARQATLVVRANNTIERILATGGVQADVTGPSPVHAHSDDSAVELTDARGELRTASFSGHVRIAVSGAQPAQAEAGRVLVTFGAKNLVQAIRAEEDVQILQRPELSGIAASHSDAESVQVRAPAVDFTVAHGRHLARAQTSAGAQIRIQPAAPDAATTTITAGRFEARFDEHSRLTSVHGAPDARIVSSSPGQPERTSAGQSLDVAFLPRGGIASIAQAGEVHYSDAELQAQGDRASYLPADQVLTLTGSPRVVDRGMATTARIMRVNRVTGNATAEGEVKSTYSDLREQPNGALLAAASPIHVTAQAMSLHRTSAVALYTGNVRLWQDSNVVQAPSIEFDRDHRSVVAQGDGQPVSTVLVQVDKQGRATPIAITSKRLTYTDDHHRAEFEGGVVVRGADATITASQVDAHLVPRDRASVNRSASSQGQLDRIVAQGKVVIQEPTRRATGDRLVYTADEDKFELTGGPPSIFDAEHGKITGDSLTFYKRDDRVLVEGRDTSPTVTTTRVAR